MGHLTELMKINHKETYVQGWAPKSCVLEYHPTPTKHPLCTHQGLSGNKGGGAFRRQV
jgi:hypothetical protein